MLKVLSLFSGIGAFEKALDNLEVPFELVNFCEFDKYAAKSYCAIHGVDESKNLGDITKVDETQLPKDLDIVTYGFPCQDISLAGKQQGLFNDDGSQTRSGLFFEALRIIEATKPKIAIAENVKNLTSKKFNAQFQIVLTSLDAAGYNSYWKVLNAKDFGIPQNRERVFIVSIRKDIDHGLFEFPEPYPLEKKLKDVLEDEVDEKYYLSEEMMKSIIGWKAHQKPFERVLGKESVAPTLTARGAGENHSGMVIYSPNNDDTRNMQTEVMDKFAIDKSHNNPQIIVREATKKGYAEAVEGDSINLEQPNSEARRGRVGKQVAQTLTTSPQQAAVVKGEPVIIDDTQGFDGVRYYNEYSPAVRASRQGLKTIDAALRIRKLTPKECFRLMGFDDESFHLAEKVNSNTQLYKQAGNSIVVDVLEELFCMMLDEDGKIFV